MKHEVYLLCSSFSYLFYPFSSVSPQTLDLFFSLYLHPNPIKTCWPLPCDPGSSLSLHCFQGNVKGSYIHAHKLAWPPLLSVFMYDPHKANASNFSFHSKAPKALQIRFFGLLPLLGQCLLLNLKLFCYLDLTNQRESEGDSPP